LKIAIIGTRGGGGIATHINELSRQLEMLGNHVAFIEPRHLPAPLALARYVRKLSSGYDIVHVHGDYDVPGLMAAIATTKALRGGTVFTTHGTGSRYWRPGKRWGALWKDSAKRFDVIISVSEYVRRRLVQILGENPPRHYTIYNGVDTNYFHPFGDASDPKRTLGVSGKYVIGYIGRLAPSKGVVYLLRAMPLLSEVRDALLLIGGRGELEGELRAEAVRLGVEDIVDFRGFIPQELLATYYGASDVVVVPSIIEAMGIVPLEAMSMKRPVVGARTGGIPELVVDGKTGLLVPPRSPEAIARAVKRLHDSPSLSVELGENGRTMVENEFTWERIAQETLKAYSYALAK
jgi:glycosyltransferase involved in cell wall biosynthesis